VNRSFTHSNYFGNFAIAAIVFHYQMPHLAGLLAVDVVDEIEKGSSSGVDAS
jgi:hypothetical protein